MEGLIDELKRNRELYALYLSIPTGLFGAPFIKQDIEQAEKAIKSGDIVEMVRTYKNLKDNE